MKGIVVMSCLAAAAALAQPAAAGGLALLDAWARATPPGTTVAAAYLTIDNRGGRADRLLSLSSPLAGSVELHAIEHAGDLVRMRRVDPLHVAAGERVELAPGALHVMLMGLTAPLLPGGRVPLTLVFERAGEMRVEAVVRAGDSADSGATQHH